MHTTLAYHPTVTQGAVAAGLVGGRLAVALPVALLLVLPLMMILMMIFMRRSMGPMRGVGPMRGMGRMRGMTGMRGMDMHTYADLFARHAELRRTCSLGTPSCAALWH